MYNQYVQDYRAQQTFNLFSQSAPEPIGYNTKLHNNTIGIVGSTTATRAAASSILHRGTTHVSLRSAAFRGTGRPLHRVGAGGLSGAGGGGVGVGGLLVDGRGDAGPVPAGAVLALGDLRVHGRDVAAAPRPRGLAAGAALHLVAHGSCRRPRDGGSDPLVVVDSSPSSMSCVVLVGALEDWIWKTDGAEHL